MDLLLDVNVIVDHCINREPFVHDVNLAMAKCIKDGGRLWIYAGSVQTIEYVTHKALNQKYKDSGRIATAKQIRAKVRERLDKFIIDKHWLSALAGEGAVFNAFDSEDEQLIRALDRFPSQSIKLLTRDLSLQDIYPNKTISPEGFIKEALKDPSTTKIDFANLQKQQDIIRPQLEQNISKVLHKCNFIMGDEVRKLEEKLQEFTGAKHCVTCSNGTDALLLAMMAMDIQPDDEIITTPFTFIATAETITLMKAKPVFVDIEEDTYNIDATKIEAAITDKTKAIMPVSL